MSHQCSTLLGSFIDGLYHHDMTVSSYHLIWVKRRRFRFGRHVSYALDINVQHEAHKSSLLVNINFHVFR